MQIPSTPTGLHRGKSATADSTGRARWTGPDVTPMQLSLGLGIFGSLFPGHLRPVGVATLWQSGKKRLLALRRTCHPPCWLVDGTLARFKPFPAIVNAAKQIRRRGSTGVRLCSTRDGNWTAPFRPPARKAIMRACSTMGAAGRFVPRLRYTLYCYAIASPSLYLPSFIAVENLIPHI